MTECKHPTGNVLITKDFYVLGEDAIQIPGCICALYLASFLSSTKIFAVVHEDGKTKIQLGKIKHQETKFRTLLVEDGLIDIINISEYGPRGSVIYMFSTPLGIKYVFDISGERKEIPSHVPRNTVGIVTKYAISYDGTVTPMSGRTSDTRKVTGYSNVESMWSNHKIFEYSSYTKNLNSVFTYRNVIDSVYTILDDDVLIFMILSERTIRVKWLQDNTVIRHETFRGEWSFGPIDIGRSLYAVDTNGVLRDIRCAWEGYKTSNIMGRWVYRNVDPDMLYSTELSPFERGEEDEKDDMKYHGMRVFNRGLAKSARKRVNHTE